MIFRIIYSSIFLFSFISTYGQPEKYKMYNINSEDGLLSDYVEYIYQDSYGFFWIANFEGLSKWDGHSFKRYQHSEKDSNSLSENISYCVFEDSERRLWVGTIKGLDLFDREKDRFIHSKIPSIL
jgi:ligand-binding sensor domain-containing protein